MKGRAGASWATIARIRMNASAPALAIRDLVKRFDRPAVDHLSLTVRRGELYALLGPNGAGKTTTLRMIATLLDPDSGAIEVAGLDAARDPLGVRRLVAWLPDEPLLYDRLTPVEYLEFIAGLWGVGPAAAAMRGEALLRQLGLWEHRGERCEGFSRGMRQKTALAGALLRDPALMIMDEPLTGLDAAAARLVKDILRERVAQGTTVILTTHILDVAERMADRIGVIARGRLVAEGTLDELRARAGGGHETLEALFLDMVAAHSGESAGALLERAA
jgi:ABC-2 type transport system ATP-binding protein